MQDSYFYYGDYSQQQAPCFAYSSASTPRKRNSLCLDATTMSAAAAPNNANAWRKSRRFTQVESTASTSLLIDSPSAEDTEASTNELYLKHIPSFASFGSNRRSSLYTPAKQQWNDFQFYGPLQQTQLDFDIPKLHETNPSLLLSFHPIQQPINMSDNRFLETKFDQKEEDDEDSVEKGEFKKGSWTKEEDDLLFKFGGMCNNKNWTEISEKIPGRSAKQCRERWTFNLDPTISKDLWSSEEDLVLINKQKEFGNKWAQIAQLLPGRTENAVKTRFKSILRAQKREWCPREDLTLLDLFQSIGSNWEMIAAKLGSQRTKHAVKMRYKELQAGIVHLPLPEKGSARQTVRECYYPHHQLQQTSEHYKKLANGQISMSLMKKASSVWSMLKQEGGNNSDQKHDPLDDFFNLYSEDDPLLVA